MNLRNMATIYLLSGERILLMNRPGSRVFNGPLTCGVGGHFEPHEINDPTLCALRELCEETGITWGDLSGIKLKYITTRLKDEEIRQQYIFFAKLSGDIQEIPTCKEGTFFWSCKKDLLKLKMSFANESALRHYCTTGRFDDAVYVGCLGVENGDPIMNWTKLQNFKTLE